MAFIDRVQIKLASGHGGRGAVHFQRTRRSPRAGPDGGDGGKGGNVILYPKSLLKDLSHLTHHGFYKAESGKPGEKDRKKGAQGKDLVLYVPEGTICYDFTGTFLKELKTKSWCFLKGGKGGKGNHFFKNARLQAPQTAQPGELALQKKLILELKWISDACLIGFRACGKTSLLLHLSQKKEKVYPSSSPRLLSIKQSNSSSILFLDLPGLSPSTRKFLKQAERTKMIIFFVSLTDENPFASYQKLKKELSTYDQKYKSALTQKPCLLLLTGEKNSVSIEKVNLFHKESVKKICFFSVNDVKQNKKLMNEILKM